MAVFVDVVELGSLSAAAAHRGVARSVITRQIATLESYLGLQLIIRSTRQQALTSAGEIYLERCKAILDLVERSEAELLEDQLKPKGNVHISLPLSFGLRQLSDLLMQFAQQYPEIHFDLHYSDAIIDVTNEGFDIAIRIAHELALSDIVRKIGECKMCFVASPHYLEIKGEPQNLDELSDHECLQYSHHSRWVFFEDGKERSLLTKGRVRANNGDALAKASVAGMGISLLPDFIAQQYIKTKQLTPILKAFKQPPIGIYVVLPSNRYIPERIRLLIEYLAENIKSNA